MPDENWAAISQGCYYCGPGVPSVAQVNGRELCNECIRWDDENVARDDAGWDDDKGADDAE